VPNELQRILTIKLSKQGLNKKSQPFGRNEMQNFYELENLIEKKRLEEGMDDKTVRPGMNHVQSIDKNQPTSGSDGFNGRNAVPDTPEGRKLDQAVRNQSFNQAVADNPDGPQAWAGKAADAQRADDRADSAEEEKIGIQPLAGRRGGKGGDTIRTSDNDIEMKLRQMDHPSAQSALLLKNILFQPQYFGKKLSFPELAQVAGKKAKLDVQSTKEALKVLRKVAGNQLRIFKGLNGLTIQIVDPFPLGGAGSAPEDANIDPENANAANDGGQFSPEAPRVTAGGPQSLKSQSQQDPLTSLIGKANDILMKVMNGEQVDTKHILDDLGNMENKLKSTATEDPDVRSKLGEIAGLKDEIERMSPQREWLELYESMCNNGI